MALDARRVTVATVAPVDAEQTLTVEATGGTFTLSAGGDPTDALDYDATSAEVQAALLALDEFAPGDLTVAGDGPHVISFGGDYAGQVVADLTVDDEEATGGTVTIETTTPGSPRTAPVRLDTQTKTDARSGSCIRVANAGDTVFLGGSDVTTTTGFPLAGSVVLVEEIELAEGEGLYGVTADGDSASVSVLETGI